MVELNNKNKKMEKEQFLKSQIYVGTAIIANQFFQHQDNLALENNQSELMQANNLSQAQKIEIEAFMLHQKALQALTPKINDAFLQSKKNAKILPSINYQNYLKAKNEGLDQFLDYNSALNFAKQNIPGDEKQQLNEKNNIISNKKIAATEAGIIGAFLLSNPAPESIPAAAARSGGIGLNYSVREGMLRSGSNLALVANKMADLKSKISLKRSLRVPSKIKSFIGDIWYEEYHQQMKDAMRDIDKKNKEKKEREEQEKNKEIQHIAELNVNNLLKILNEDDLESLIDPKNSLTENIENKIHSSLINNNKG